MSQSSSSGCIRAFPFRILQNSCSASSSSSDCSWPAGIEIDIGLPATSASCLERTLSSCSLSSIALETTPSSLEIIARCITFCF
nr:hypothetical protein Iba_chr02eCG8250 [Ipomoea batatas]